MTQTSLTPPVAPSETQVPDLPAALTPLVLEQTPAAASPDDHVPPRGFDLEDDRYYAEHWGINE
jgi:hypothetical protein